MQHPGGGEVPRALPAPGAPGRPDHFFYAGQPEAQLAPETNTDARQSRLSLNYEDPDGHVVFSRFGLTPRNTRSELERLLEELPAVRPTVAEILALSAYQTEYGIYNHQAPDHTRPLALVAMHPKEDVLEGGPLFSHIRRYHQHQIQQHFRLSLVEFLELPPYLVDLLYDITPAESHRTQSITRQIQHQLDHDLKGD
jgi:hypothetical protein